MSLLNEQRKRNQTMQQVKELARNGQWAEAKKLVDTLPNSPDVLRIRNSIEKQLFIATGEVPSVMENSMAAAEMDESIGTKPPAVKVKRQVSGVPSYHALYAMSFLLYGLGGLAILGGFIMLLIPPTQYEVFGTMYTQSYRGLGVSFIGVGIGMVVSGELWRVFRDIARNTSLTTILLQRLVDKSAEQ